MTVSLMEFLTGLLHNRMFWSAASAWFIAQLTKNLIDLTKGGYTLDRIGGGGGMPSAHSATVTGLCAAAGMTQGGDSGVFAVSLFLAIIVIYDALGVRWVTGRQSVILNRMRKAAQAGKEKTGGEEIFPEKPLPEKMGHTLPEIIAGICIGLVCAYIVCAVIFPRIG